MKTNNELKIAVAVGIIMALICVIVLMVQNNKKNEVYEIKIAKHYDYEDETAENYDEKGYYLECTLTTEEKSTINRELKKIDKLDEDTKVSKSITGNYEIILNDTTIYAFDNAEDNVIYRGEDGTMHEFSSSMYQTIIDRCEG